MTFVAWDPRVARLALSTGRAFVTFDARISLEEARRVSMSKGLEGTPRLDEPQAAGGTPGPVSCRPETPRWCRQDSGPRRTELRAHIMQEVCWGRGAESDFQIPVSSPPSREGQCSDETICHLTHLCGKV